MVIDSFWVRLEQQMTVAKKTTDTGMTDSKPEARAARLVCNVVPNYLNIDAREFGAQDQINMSRCVKS